MPGRLGTTDSGRSTSRSPAIEMRSSKTQRRPQPEFGRVDWHRRETTASTRLCGREIATTSLARMNRDEQVDFSRLSRTRTRTAPTTMPAVRSSGGERTAGCRRRSVDPTSASRGTLASAAIDAKSRGRCMRVNSAELRITEQSRATTCRVTGCTHG